MMSDSDLSLLAIQEPKLWFNRDPNFEFFKGLSKPDASRNGVRGLYWVMRHAYEK
jgi:hypothetical protein